MVFDPWKTEKQKHQRLQELIHHIKMQPKVELIETAKKDYIDLYQRTEKPTHPQKLFYNQIRQEILDGELKYCLVGE